MRLQLLLVCAIALVACTENASPPANTSAHHESKSSEEFYLAMERGDYDRGVALLREELQKPNPKPEVMFNMGLAYQQGAGVKKDLSQAAQWYEKAAEMGDADAQFNLGVLYSTGSGVPKSLDKAAALYRSAAVQGNASAQYNLGRAYLASEGVAENATSAYVWLSQAATSNGPAAAPAQRTLSRLSERLSEQETAAAKQMALACEAPKLDECPGI